MATLTSANAVLRLGVASIFPNAQQIQGFDTDDAFATARVTPAQTKMGVDGKLSGGYVPTEKKTTIFLQADSASNQFFDTWQAQQDAAQESFVAFGIIIIPALSQSFALTRGFLTGYPVMSTAKKIMQRLEYEITWESILGSPIL